MLKLTEHRKLQELEQGIDPYSRLCAVLLKEYRERLRKTEEGG